MEGLLRLLRGQVFAFNFAEDRERFRVLVMAQLDEIVVPRVCPKCHSAWWDEKPWRTPTGVAAHSRQTQSEGLIAEPLAASASSPL